MTTDPANDAAAPIRIALIGAGIQLSRTPRMHVEEGRALGLDYRYDLIDVDLTGETDIAALLARAEAEGYRGVNVTHPFKQAALPLMDTLSDAARAVNAVNTVLFRDGRRHGANTDHWGFAEAFRTRLAGAPRARVLQLGAGGAGGAVAHALLDQGVGHLAIRDLDAGAAARLAEDLAARVGADRVSVVDDAAAALATADGVVNATPVGMAAHPGLPLPAEALTPRHWVADIIYFPMETALLAAARARGCRVMDGSAMAVFQAVRAFELFSGRRPDPERMRATFDACAP